MYVVRTANRGDAVRGKCGQYERRSGPQVADFHLCTMELCGAFDDGVVLVCDIYVCAHAAQFAQPFEPVFEDRFMDVADAGRLSQHHACGRLQVRGQARVGLRFDVTAAQRGQINVSRVDFDGVVAAVHRDTHVRDDAQECAQVVARGACEGDVAASHAGRGDEGSGLDPVRHDRMIRAAQAPSTFDLDSVRGCALDLSAHLLEEADEIVDLGLLGGRLDDGVAVGQDGCQHGILGAHDGDLRKVDGAATKPAGGLGEVVAVAVVDLGSESPHGVNVKVDRPPADTVAAGVADDHAAEPGKQGPEQDEAGPHLGRGLERDEGPLGVAGGNLV